MTQPQQAHRKLLTILYGYVLISGLLYVWEQIDLSQVADLVKFALVCTFAAINTVAILRLWRSYQSNQTNKVWYLLQTSFLCLLLTRLYATHPVWELFGFMCSLLSLPTIPLPPALVDQKQYAKQLCATAGKSRLELLNTTEWATVIGQTPAEFRNWIVCLPELANQVALKTGVDVLKSSDDELTISAPKIAEIVESQYKV